MNKLALAPIVAFALGACADQPGLLAPDPVIFNLQAEEQNEYLAFVSTAPDPGVVGNIYEARVEVVSQFIWLLSLDSSGPACHVEDEVANPPYTFTFTVSLREAGTCTITAHSLDLPARSEIVQTFQVVGSSRRPTDPGSNGRGNRP